MSRKIKLQLNRVEGDLEIELEVTDGIVTNAWCIGTMYRGFEQILIGRTAMDALAITPRICGICSTAHLYASVLAIESIAKVTPPANAIRVRNICLLSEEIQSDCRQSFLMFTPDLCHLHYQNQLDYARIVELFEDLKGEIYQGAIIHSRAIIEIVAIFGGQWPHSSYMVPGGVTSLPDQRKVLNALSQVKKYIQWFEQQVLATSLQEWLNLSTLEQLDRYAENTDSAMALLHRFCRSLSLDQVGDGANLLMSYGSIINPEEPDQHYRQAGVLDLSAGQSPQSQSKSASLPYLQPQSQTQALDPSLIQEDIAFSWFHDDSAQARHPAQGLTQPKYDPDSDKYTWAKAPRYDGRVVQTGAVAQLAVAGDALILDLLTKLGSTTWVRQFARIHRQASSLLHLAEHLESLLQNIDAPTMVPCPLEDGDGVGMIEAARGSLGHWMSVREGKITNFQVITPTSWNASPRDSDQQPGHIEQSLVGLSIPDPDDPLEVGHVVRSHDPCLVCTVHLLDGGQKHRFGA